MIKKAVSECWKEIMVGFLEFGFSEEEIEFEINIEKEIEEIVIKFHPKFQSILEKHFDAQLPTFFERYKKKIKFEEGAIKTTLNHGLFLAIVQFIIFTALENMKKEKKETIEEINTELKREIKSIFGRSAFSNIKIKCIDIFYNKGKYYASIKLKSKKNFPKEIITSSYPPKEFAEKVRELMVGTCL